MSVEVTTPGGALVEMVVRRVSGGGGGVASFLVVVAAISAVEISGGVVVLPVVAVTAADVTEVTSGVDVTGSRGTSVVLAEVTSRTTVVDGTSGGVFTVGLKAEVEEVSQCHGSEKRTVDAGRVELSAVGKLGKSVVFVGGIGGKVGFVVTGGPVGRVDISGGLEVVVRVVFSAGGTAVVQEVLSV